MLSKLHSHFLGKRFCLLDVMTCCLLTTGVNLRVAGAHGWTMLLYTGLALFGFNVVLRLFFGDASPGAPPADPCRS